MEGKVIEIEHKEESALRKTALATRNAKAAILLSSLKNRLLDPTAKPTIQEAAARLRRENEDLRMKLVAEKVRNRKIKLCGFAEFLLKAMLCMGFWSLLCLLVGFGFF